MSDYKFMLETHLSAEQNRTLMTIQETAAEAGLAIFLTGGALRDMMGGFPIRDLDFTVEGNAIKLAKILEKKAVARIVSTDEIKKSAELLFAGGVTSNISMARTEKSCSPLLASRVAKSSPSSLRFLANRRCVRSRQDRSKSAPS